MSDYDSISGLQEQGLIDSKKVAILKTCFISFFHNCVAAVLMSQIFSIWLNQEVHLDSLQIGELLGMKTIVAIFYKPLFGWLLDKTQLRIRFIITLGIAGLGAGPFFQFVYKPLLMTHNPTLFYVAGLLGGVYFGYVIIAGGPAVWSYCGRYIEAHGGTIDNIGVSSSIAWILMGFVLTMLYTINPTWGFYLASLAACGMIISLLTLKIKPFDTLNTRTTSKQKMKLVDLKELIFTPRFYVLAFFAMTIMVVVYAQYGQVGRYSLSFWPKDKQTFGLRFIAYLSVPVGLIHLFFISRASSFIKKFNPSRTMILLATAYGVALLGFGLSALFKDHYGSADHYIPSLVASIVAHQLLGLVNPFTIIIVLSYVTTSFNQKIAGTAFLVGFHFLTNLLGSFGHGIVGGMFKVQGWGVTYCELAIFIFICTIILMFLMMYSNAHDRKRVMKHLEDKKEEQS